MRRIFLAAALGLLWARPVSGQSALVYLNPGADSVLPLKPSGTGAAELSVYSACYGVSAYSVTLLFDDAKLSVQSATAVAGRGFPDPTIITGTNQATLAATGAPGDYNCTTPVATVRFAMAGGTVDGSLIDIRVNSLTGYSSEDLLPNHKTDPLEACKYSKLWGDLDNSGVVTSRDALIALSAAVGLPVNGFDTSVGDVDSDQALTSRDALFILSTGIGLFTGSRAGRAVLDRCAPLAPAPSDLVFFSNRGAEIVNAGDTLRNVVSLAVSANQASPIRWSPDGTKLAYECFAAYPYNQDICVVNRDGTGAVSLNVGAFVRDAYATWSPDGTQIAFAQGDGSTYVFVANADGSNKRQVSSNHAYIYGLDWSPDGTRLAFTTYDYAYAQRLLVVGVDGSGEAELFTNSWYQSPRAPSWSPGSDSIAYYSGNNLIYKAAATGGQPGVPASRVTNGLNHPSWTSAGIAFRRLTQSGRSDIYLLRSSDGRHFRLTHGTSGNGDERPDLRRTGGVYVSSVSVSPKPVNVSGVTPVTATVANSDASANVTTPLTWISRNTGLFTVAPSGARTADVTGVATGSAYLVVTVGGWRTDSALVVVP